MRDAGVPVLEAPDRAGRGRPARCWSRRLPAAVAAACASYARSPRLADEIAKAEAEAASAFGDGTVFVEPYVEHGRHVEVQVVGDRHGGVLVLGERDCSVQRRHQKVVEEAPAPDIDPGVVEAMHDGRAQGRRGDRLRRRRHRRVPVRRRARAVLLPGDEHPAPGRAPGHRARARRRPGRGAAPRRRGARARRRGRPRPARHAIEVRLYAEDPAPTGSRRAALLTHVRGPGVVGRVRPARPVAASGSTPASSPAARSSTHYDAMLAKVVAWAPDPARGGPDARRRAAPGAGCTAWSPTATCWSAILRDDDVPRRARSAPTSSTRRPVVESRRRRRPTSTCCSPRRSPWPSATRAAPRVQRGIPVAWRNVVSQPQRTTFAARAATSTRSSWHGGRDGYASTTPTCACSRASPDRGRARGRPGQRRRSAQVAVRGRGRRGVRRRRPAGHVRLRGVPRFVDPADVVAQRSLLAPMPGTVVGVPVEEGAEVDRRAAGAGARGDEDAAHDQRARRRRRQRARRGVGAAGGGGRGARRRGSTELNRR